MRPLNYIVPVALLGMTACKPKYEEVSPKIAPVTEAVFASGSIVAKDAYIVTSLSDGFIVKSYVSEGDAVQKGQVLYRLDNRQQRTQVRIAETNVAYAKINAAGNSPALLQIKAQLEASRAKMHNDSTTLTRYEHLFRTQSVSKQDLDNARFNYKSSVSNYQANLENYRVTADKVRQDLANTESQLQNAEAGNQYYTLTAADNGKVYQVFKKQGDMVKRGEQVAQVGNPDSIVINLDVDENSIAKVHTGQQVLVELNMEKNKMYEATVTKIYPYFNESAQSYKVEARFTQPMRSLIPGTQLQANIVTNKKDKALLIPHQFVIGDNKVLIKKGKEIDTVTIATGITSYDWVEVVSGLTVNDKIARLK